MCMLTFQSMSQLKIKDGKPSLIPHYINYNRIQGVLRNVFNNWFLFAFIYYCFRRYIFILFVVSINWYPLC